MKNKTRVGIIGAGIAGSTIANELQQRGFFDIILFEHAQKEQIVSSVAAAFLCPYPDAEILAEKSGNQNLFLRWQRESFRFYDEMKQKGAKGIYPLDVRLVFDKKPELRIDELHWKNDFKGVVLAKEIPRNFSYAWSLGTLLVHSNKYFPSLREKIQRAGATITRKYFESLTHAKKEYPAVNIWIVAAGIHNKKFLEDDQTYGALGHLVELEIDQKYLPKEYGGILHCNQLGQKTSMTHQGYKYLIWTGVKKNGKIRVLAGGTPSGKVETVRGEELFTHPIAKKVEREKILAMCKDLLPQLEKAEYVSDLIGYRPNHEKGPHFGSTNEGVWYVNGLSGNGYEIMPALAKDLVTQIENSIKSNKDNLFIK